MNGSNEAKTFEVILTAKNEVEKETEFSISEYLPGMQKIVKTDLSVNILETDVEDGSVGVRGELKYEILYVSDNDNLLKKAEHKDEFSKTFEIQYKNIKDRSSLDIITKPSVAGVTGKIITPRKGSIRSKFLVEITVIDSEKEISGCMFNDAEINSLEILDHEYSVASMRISPDNLQRVHETVRIDDNVPEIYEIIKSDCTVCVGDVKNTDGSVGFEYKLIVNCLYSTKNETNTDYITFTKEIPLVSEFMLNEADENDRIAYDVRISDFSLEPAADNYGESKNINVSADVFFDIYTIANNMCSVVNDIYIPGKKVDCKIKEIMIPALYDVYSDTVYYEQKIKSDLKNIHDIICSDVHLMFAPVEMIESKAYLPAKGNVSIVAVRESGDIDAMTSYASFRIPLESLTERLPSESMNVSVMNFASVCSYECTIIGGEIVLKLWVNDNCAVFTEASTSVVCEYNITDSENSPQSKKGFTLYYPDNGESIWRVAKSHGASYSKLLTENGISGDSFVNIKNVLLHE